MTSSQKLFITYSLFKVHEYTTRSDMELPMLSLTTATSEMQMQSFLIFQFSLNSDRFLNFLGTFLVPRKICKCPISLQETKNIKFLDLISP